MSWTRIGDPSNAADPTDGDDHTMGVQQFGAVGYSYSIGTYDVTNSQYVEFLNAKDPTGANLLGLYGGAAANYSVYGGINYTAGNLPGTSTA